MVSLGIRRWIVAALAVASGGIPALAQAPEGRITGTVRDARGPVLAGATVTATHLLTRLTSRTVTGGDGTYTLSGLAPGAYTVAATQIGFRRETRTEVQVDGETTVDFVLQQVTLQTVVVTATLREQEAMEVPFSIAAPTGEELRERGVETIEDIAANVAGFSVQNLGPGQSQVAIRGASAGQIARDQPGVKEQAGVYLDDSPISLSLFTPDLDLFDLSRVEVLRGPQGTLFGAGSLAGTVRYITNQPELGVRSTFGEVGGTLVDGGGVGGNFRLGANVPLGDRMAARVAAYQNRFAGYMDAVQPDFSVNENVNSGTRSGVRAALLLQPGERLRIVPRVVYQNVRMDGWNRIDAFNILANPYTTTRPPVTLGEREQFTQMEEPYTDDFLLGDLNVRWDWGPANLTSITSYSHRDILVVRDAGALTSSITGGTIGLEEEIYTLDAPLDDETDVDVLTQEVRLAGGTGMARWLVGGFVSSSKREYAQTLRVGGFEAGTGIPTVGLRAQRDELFWSDLSYDMTQSALFGEATATVLPRVDLTAGLRYYSFDEERDQVFDGIFAHDNTGTSVVSVPGETSSSGFAPRFIASIRPTDMLTLNAQAARGFRLGGINDPLNLPLCSPIDSATFGGLRTWDDETVWNYEVGAKALLLGGRASFNASAFHMDIRDLQLNVTAGTCSSRITLNVPKAISRGLELEVAAAPSELFDFSVSATFTNAELRSTVTSTDTLGVERVVSGIRKGNRLPSVPETQFAAAATVRRPLRNGAQGFLSGSVSHIGSRYTQIDDLTPGIDTVDIATFGENIGGPLTRDVFVFDPELPAYTIANLRLGITRGNWETALFVNNLTDERAFLALDRERGLLARVGYLTNQPRTFGLTLGFSY